MKIPTSHGTSKFSFGKLYKLGTVKQQTRSQLDRDDVYMIDLALVNF
jgi:hypothetical protein